MRLHMDLRVAELRRVPPNEAEAQARRNFGNVLLLREEAREIWGWNFLDTLAQDLRNALRQF